MRLKGEIQMKLKVFTTIISILLLVTIVHAEEPSEIIIPEFDPSGTYNAFIGFTTENWIHRNEWACVHFGINGASWVSGGGVHEGSFFNVYNGDNGIQPGIFKDIKIEGNGKYRVSVENFDFGECKILRTLFVSFDIPIDREEPLEFSDVVVIMDGVPRSFFDGSDGNMAIRRGIDDGERGKVYYELHVINQWSRDLGGETGLFGYPMPQESVVVEFTVSGFDYDKEEDEEIIEEETVEIIKENEALLVFESNEDSNNSGIAISTILLIAGGALMIIGAAVMVIVKKK
jgi:hypothetical protein